MLANGPLVSLRDSLVAQRHRRGTDGGSVDDCHLGHQTELARQHSTGVAQNGRAAFLRGDWPDQIQCEKLDATDAIWH